MGEEIISIHTRLTIILESYLVRHLLPEAVITVEGDKSPSHSSFLTKIRSD